MACQFPAVHVLAQVRETLSVLRADHEALCALLIEGGIVSVRGLAQMKMQQRSVAMRRACPLYYTLDMKGIAVTATRFMTRDDHVRLRTTSKEMSVSLSATSPAVAPSKILVADDRVSAELFDTRSCRWEPLPLVEHHKDRVSAVIRGRLYVCGGWNAASAQCFDPLQNTWRSLHPMAVLRWGAAAAVVGDHLYVCGGRKGVRLLCSTERLDTWSEVWEASPAMAQGRQFAGAAVIGGRIYVVGGLVHLDGTSTSSAERFGGAWTTLPRMAQRRVCCSTAVIANRLYVSGSEHFNIQNVPSSLERFDPALGTWAPLRPMLHRRFFAATACLRGRLFVCGGRENSWQGGVLQSVECYDPHTDSWEEAAPMSHARCGPKVATANGCLYVFGGGPRSAERFDPVTGRWEVLPAMTVGEVSLVAAIRA